MTGVDVGMLVRRPAGEVFQAFADPAVTTRFWYTRSSGPMTSGATLRWDWEMYDLSTTVRVLEVEQDSRIVFEWNDDRVTMWRNWWPTPAADSRSSSAH